jgi:hypothetical protein
MDPTQTQFSSIQYRKGHAMTKQTEFVHSLVGSPAGSGISRLSALTLAAVLLAGGAIAGLAQDQPATPAPQAPAAETPAKPAPPKAPLPSDSTEKKMGNYMVHSMVELGGTITDKSGSTAMWATMVNQGTGMRLVGQSLEMHSTNTSKTPFFDTLSSASYGYGGNPIDTTFLKFSKGKWYDFDSSFRRNRSYFDYNLLVNPFLTSATNATPVLVPVPSSLHLFNTVRRNTNTLVTILPISRVSFRAGYSHGTNEGPTYSSVHGGGDVSVFQWWRNALDTYIGGVDLKLGRRSILSYDQFYGLYRGDTSNTLAGATWQLANGTPVSQGFNVLTGPTVTCGSNADKTQNVLNGISNPFCNQTIVQSQGQPIRTAFPTEQLRFSAHQSDKVVMNGRFTYSGGVTNVNGFNETFNGFLSRSTLRQEIDTGGLNSEGRLAHNKRVNVNADYGIEAEINKWFSVSDAFNFWDVRMPSNAIMVSQIWDNTPFVAGGPTPVPSSSLNVNTPLSSLHNYTNTNHVQGFLSHENIMNTALATFTVMPEFKFSAGWRFNNREIKYAEDPTQAWHQNGVLLGAVIQPSRAVRVNLNFESMNSHSANSATQTDTYTRPAPNSTYHIQARAVATPKKWVNFAVAVNDFQGKNDDPLVNHTEYARDFSFAAQFIPMETLTLDFNYAHDIVFSQTDMCYAFTATANASVPAGAANSGTCTAANGGSSSLYLGYGYYNAPSDFFIGALNYAPSKKMRFNGGFRMTQLNGSAELLNPYNPPGALLTKVISPFADLEIHIAPQWSWHGNWEHHGYEEGGPSGGNVVGPGSLLPSRDFHGEVVTLSVKYAF